MSRRDRLGRGLGALLGEYLEPEASDAEVRSVPLASILPNPLQPRRTFTDAELVDLAASIEANGLLQPLVVRPAPGADGRFELVAGERRLRALGRLGWSDAPALVRDATDETMLVLALVENLQREALSPMEEAEGYRALAERFRMTQADIARAVGKDRSTVANFLRLLRLPASVRKLLEDGRLSMGHARALLAVDDEVRAGELARAAAREGWSVREVERKAANTASRDATRRRPERRRVDPVVRAVEQALEEALSTRVAVKQTRDGKGSIEISYVGSEDFERVFEIVTGRRVNEVVE